MSAAPRPRRSAHPTTLAALLSAAARRLARAGVSFGHGTTNARDEAAWLIQHALGMPVGALDAAALRRPVAAADAQRALALIDERVARRVPAAYLIGEAWLRGRRFRVDARVIVPRSFLAELLDARLAPWLAAPARVRRVLDLCTGSGCLAILAAQAFPRAQVDAVDLSSAALEVAAENVAAYRLGRRIELLQGNLFAPVHGRQYDLILSNPPYVPAAAMRRLPAEYRREPTLALAGGEDGFALVEPLLRAAARHLTPDGLLVVEIGHYRRQFAAAYPHLACVWPPTSGGDDCVFAVTRDALQARGALSRRPAPRRARRESAASPRR